MAKFLPNSSQDPAKERLNSFLFTILLTKLTKKEEKMLPYQENSSNASMAILRNDSLVYSVSDAGSEGEYGFADEGFETYCDRADNNNTKEVVIVFGEGFHQSFQQHQQQHEQQHPVVAVQNVVDDAMMQQVKAMRISSSATAARKEHRQPNTNDSNAWHFPQPASFASAYNKENAQRNHHHVTPPRTFASYHHQAQRSATMAS